MISNNFSEMNENKPSSKVSRPPGGGSSDIFGADMPSTPRNVKNHMQSNIFSNEKNLSAFKNNGDQPRRAQKNADSYTRLFGEPDRPFTPARNHMKSSIPFGGSAELLANGNGHHHGASSNGKNGSGSVSSASSSVSSSTENLKINGVSKTEIEEICSSTQADVVITPRKNPNTNCDQNTTANGSAETAAANADIKNNSIVREVHTLNTAGGDTPSFDVTCSGVSSQTRQNAMVNTSEDPTRTTMTSSFMAPENCRSSSATLSNRCRTPRANTPRNPITGLGLGCDGDRPRRNVIRRDGNPVTGEGYKPAGVEINTTIPSLNGANQVINKNRIPPGGFSSGLW